MYDVKRVSRSRCLLTWLAATVAAAALIGWLATDLAAAHRALTGTTDLSPAFDSWLTWLCALAAALCAVWGWLVTSLVVLEALTGRARRAPTPGVPVWARRLVLAVCGAAVLASAGPATADDRPGPRRAEAPSVLEGLPLPDRAEGPSTTELVTRTIETSPVRQSEPDPPVAGQHLVRPGDSLWSIAETALLASGSTATDAEVSAYWPRIYALNRDLVGPDPDLLHPGQLLRLADPPAPTPGLPTGEDLR
jgi:hypothetical protein